MLEINKLPKQVLANMGLLMCSIFLLQTGAVAHSITRLLQTKWLTLVQLCGCALSIYVLNKCNASQFAVIYELKKEKIVLPIL